MIPQDIRLYTWVDVEEVLVRAQQEHAWPKGLIWARAYWDGLTLGIHNGTKDQILAWLSDRFDPRFDLENARILLQSMPGEQRELATLFEETTETPARPRFSPSLARPSVLWPPSAQEYPEPMPLDWPPVIAFHSFKGGVGRTLHALAFARAITNKQGVGSRVLLVDGDLEAPGLTWLIRNRFPTPPVSFVDFLSLVHGDPNPDAKGSIELVANQIGNLLLDDIYILPAFRSPAQFSSLEIKPEHLIQGARDPFIFTTMLAKLGKSLGVDAVIIDLRAGLSELSTGLLLDARVYRVLVTTLSDQSIEGTCLLLDLLGKTAPPRQEDDPLPALIVAQIPTNLQQGDLLKPFEERLISAAMPLWKNEQGGEEENISLPSLIDCDFNQEFQVLPGDWNDLIARLDKSRLLEQIDPLVDWLPISPPASAEIPKPDPARLKPEREKLARFANRLIYAETGDLGEFLAISPLRNLAADFSAKGPIVVVVGAKGSGKTYTFLQVVRRETWETFVRDTGIPNISVAARISPILKPKNLEEKANLIVQGTKRKTTQALDLASPHPLHENLDYLRNSLRENLHEGEWRERWLDVIAWSTGFEAGQQNAGRGLANYLREKDHSIVVVIDGLEDLFQGLSSNNNQQIALRSLLQDVPEWLEQQPSRPIGLLVFVRQDMVIDAVKQNPAQLLARHEPYALRWGSEEALRLVAWIAAKVEVLSLKIKQLPEMRKSALVDALVPLWGRKLGSDRSREGQSAEWIIAALSDLNGQIQARDIVRFLYEAAQDSATDTYWKDRLLVPAAIRRTVKICGEEKIKEIEKENPVLGKILSKLSQLSDEERQIPFTQEQIPLTREEFRILEDNGIILREGEEYDMSEIFRQGLDFKLKGGRRPRVLTLARRVRR
ncbi:MAG: ParA family protein [Chloroflexi bacterium]|nr:ParA family protein [Chloroflexota bacterium]